MHGKGKEGMESIALNIRNEVGEKSKLYLAYEEVNGKPKPIILGTGRNAIVLLGHTAQTVRSTGNSFVALKFVKADINEQYAGMIRERFWIEMTQTRDFGSQRFFFVQFLGVGVIGELEPHLERWPNGVKNESELLEKLRVSYKLQGPFYALELCQGSLEDVLEKRQPWINIGKSYNDFSDFKREFLKKYDDVRGSLRVIKAQYLDKAKHAQPLSGYDILNAFNDEPIANAIRNYASLELFDEITTTMRQLHTNFKLTHRDLKPGNIFIKHPIEVNQIFYKLADLGYVADVRQLQGLGWSKVAGGWRNPGTLAPGSIHYHAPEQAEPPTEVRVSFLEHDKRKVSIYASKLLKVDKGDWLIIGDFFEERTIALGENEETDYTEGLFRIKDVVEPVPGDGEYVLELDFTPEDDFELELESDLQAFIVRLTGFHSDGFSLGAILYDIISGGRDPELFYRYCLVGFHKVFRDQGVTLEHIVRSLAPNEVQVLNDRERFRLLDSELTAKQKFAISRNVISAKDADGLIEDILAKSLDLSVDPDALQNVLTNYRYTKFPMVDRLLRDKRMVKIPSDILTVIIRCMLRDIEGCYYDSVGPDGFLSLANVNAITRLDEDIKDLLGKPSNRFPKDFPAEFRNNLLVQLRMFWNVPDGNYLQTEVAEPPQPDDNIDTGS